MESEIKLCCLVLKIEFVIKLIKIPGFQYLNNAPRHKHREWRSMTEVAKSHSTPHQGVLGPHFSAIHLTEQARSVVSCYHYISTNHSIWTINRKFHLFHTPAGEVKSRPTVVSLKLEITWKSIIKKKLHRLVSFTWYFSFTITFFVMNELCDVNIVCCRRGDK